MVETVSTVMQLLKGLYFSVAAGSRHNVIRLSRTAQCSELCFTCFKVKYKICRLDIDFNLEVCGVIMFLED